MAGESKNGEGEGGWRDSVKQRKHVTPAPAPICGSLGVTWPGRAECRAHVAGTSRRRLRCPSRLLVSPPLSLRKLERAGALAATSAVHRSFPGWARWAPAQLHRVPAPWSAQLAGCPRCRRSSFWIRPRAARPSHLPPREGFGLFLRERRGEEKKREGGGRWQT